MANSFSQWLEQKEQEPELLNESRRKRLTPQERLAKLKKSKKGKWGQLSSKNKKMVALSFRTSMKGMKGKGGGKMSKRGATLESIEDKGLFPRLMPSFGI